MTTSITSITDRDTLQAAKDGSFYTIIGAGGDPAEWVKGYEDLLEKEGIGKPKQWFTTTGAAVNSLAGVHDGPRAFQLDLTFLLFPLDGLHVGKLALFKINMMDRWFDDVVDNMRRQ